MTKQEDRYDVEKLPKWAQAHIKALEERIGDLTLQLHALQGSQETRIRVTSLDHAPIYLPDHARVEFDQGRGTQQRLAVYVERAGITVRSSWGRIRVLPDAANAVHIELE